MVAVTRAHYRFIDVQKGAAGTLCARFAVEDAGGQTHEELLTFTAIETRIRLWDDEMERNPGYPAADPVGFANYRQYVQALVEGLKRHAV